MPTEQEIREWVRSENEKIVAEKQETCLHLKSGTLRENNEVVCNQCEHVLTDKDYGRYIVK